MWKQAKLLYSRMQTPFTAMTAKCLQANLLSSLGSKIYYTPKLQKMPFTQQLAKYLRFLDRKDKIRTADLRAMVEAILTEYGEIHQLEGHPKFRENLDYSITQNYQFKENELSPYHGEVDYMIWLNHEHFVPVYFCEGAINPVAGMALAHATMALKCMARNNLQNSGYSIVTTGQEWQMFKVYNSLNSEKTVIYEGNNRFRNIVKDYEMVETVLGLIDECLETDREEVKLLKLAYDVIDERKYMLEASTPEQAQANSPVSKWLTKYFEKQGKMESK